MVALYLVIYLLVPINIAPQVFHFTPHKPKDICFITLVKQRRGVLSFKLNYIQGKQHIRR